MKLTKKKPDKREYTFMIVPHRDDKIYSLRVPIKRLKLIAGSIATCLVVCAGLFTYQAYTVQQAASSQSELQELRANKDVQEQKLVVLAQKTTEIQKQISEIEALENEVKRALGNPETSSTSRSGVERTERSGGQGGPIAKNNVDSLQIQLNSLEAALKSKDASLKELKSQLEERNQKLARTPSIWPTEGDITSRFGWRQSPFGYGSDWHPGVDIANSIGTPIHATADGVVTNAGWYGGYGRYVEIDHGYGYVTAYGHHSAIVVAIGQQVKKGDVIAYVGNSGMSTGPHVHYEVRVNGREVNPMTFMQ